jgi:hypothetical protein
MTASAPRLLGVVALLAAAGAAPASDGGPPGDRPSGSAVPITIGYHVTTIPHIDWKDNSFKADLYWWIKYPDPGTEEACKRMEALEFVNLDPRDSATKLQERKTLQGPDGPQEYAAYRTAGRFYFRPDFRKYPLDTQELPIIVEHEVLTSDEVEFVENADDYRSGSAPPSRWGIAGDLPVAGEEQILGTRRTFGTHVYGTSFGDPAITSRDGSYSRATLTIVVGRNSYAYLIRIAIPLLIILCLAYLAFFVPATKLEVSAALTVTSLLAAIAFQITIANDLPGIGYRMVSDQIFHLCYLLIMLAMAETVLTFNLDRLGRPSLAQRIEVLSRWTYPTVLGAGAAAIVATALWRP